jgi:hypothetical protein
MRIVAQNVRIKMNIATALDIEKHSHYFGAELEFEARCVIIDDLRIDNARLKALVDEISVLITEFKKARNTTRSIDAIAKMVVWNVEQEDRIGKERRSDEK